MAESGGAAEETEAEVEEGKVLAVESTEGSECPSEWSCSKCTFVNNENKLCCEMCRTERGRPKVETKKRKSRGGQSGGAEVAGGGARQRMRGSEGAAAVSEPGRRRRKRKKADYHDIAKGHTGGRVNPDDELPGVHWEDAEAEKEFGLVSNWS
jgi:hypothetical protein